MCLAPASVTVFQAGLKNKTDPNLVISDGILSENDGLKCSADQASKVLNSETSLGIAVTLYHKIRLLPGGSGFQPRFLQ
jgi:hypothetical protein